MNAIKLVKVTCKVVGGIVTIISALSDCSL